MNGKRFALCLLTMLCLILAAGPALAAGNHQGHRPAAHHRALCLCRQAHPPGPGRRADLCQRAGGRGRQAVRVHLRRHRIRPEAGRCIVQKADGQAQPSHELRGVHRRGQVPGPGNQRPLPRALRFHLLFRGAGGPEQEPLHVRFGPHLRPAVRHPAQVHRRQPETGGEKAHRGLLLQRHRVRPRPHSLRPRDGRAAGHRGGGRRSHRRGGGGRDQPTARPQAQQPGLLHLPGLRGAADSGRHPRRQGFRHGDHLHGILLDHVQDAAGKAGAGRRGLHGREPLCLLLPHRCSHDPDHSSTSTSATTRTWTTAPTPTCRVGSPA